MLLSFVFGLQTSAVLLQQTLVFRLSKILHCPFRLFLLSELCLGERSLFFGLGWSRGKHTSLWNQCLLSIPGLDGCWTPKHPWLLPCNRVSDWLLPDVPPNAPGSVGLARPLDDVSLRESWRSSTEDLPFGVSLSLQGVPAGLAVGLLTRLYRGSRDLGWIMWIPPMGIRRFGALLGCWECRGRWLRRLWAPRGRVGCGLMWVGPTSSTDYNKTRGNETWMVLLGELGHYTSKMKRMQTATEADLNGQWVQLLKCCGNHNCWWCRSIAMTQWLLGAEKQRFKAEFWGGALR